MEELLAYRTDLLSALAGVVHELSKTITSLPADTLHQALHTDIHTPHYLLFHLRELEAQVFAVQLPRILFEENPILPVFDDDTWMDNHYHAEEPVSAILDELVRLRQNELAWLPKLSPANWSRLARHTWWGEHTFQWWVELQVDYSFQHLKAISSVLNI